MTEDPTRAERENLALRRKLQHLERKIRVLESLHDQNTQAMRALMADLESERAESERLLLNILPEPIAARLKAESGVIAERFASASILFADLVGFTALSEALTAEEMVRWLNDVYSAFDGYVRSHGVEKIRTIGDNYMVAAGVPFPRDDHAVALTRLALDVRDHIATLSPVAGRRVDFRIGIASGPVVGGVIGKHKFQYDIWGNAVNTASRMESHGVPGRIQITDATHALIAHAFVCEPRGTTQIKSKGFMSTWFVLRPK